MKNSFQFSKCQKSLALKQDRDDFENNRRYEGHQPNSLNIISIPIATVRQVDYLYVILTTILSNIPHVNKTLSRVNGAFKSLYSIIHFNRPTSQIVRICC